MDLDSFDSPESSSIVRGTYDRDTEIATLTFKRRLSHAVNAGAPVDVDYRGQIPPDVWDELVGAVSKGQFFNQFIRLLYSFVEVSRV